VVLPATVWALIYAHTRSENPTTAPTISPFDTPICIDCAFTIRELFASWLIRPIDGVDH